MCRYTGPLVAFQRNVSKGVSKIYEVANIKARNATIPFVSSLPFFLLALSIFPLLFLRWCDFPAYRAQKTCLLALFTTSFVRFVFKNSVRCIICIKDAFHTQTS